jgi:hypothetical protein
MNDLKNIIKGKSMIIGSTAIKYHFPNTYKREPKDLDIATKLDQKHVSQEGVEFLFNPILEYVSEYASPQVLLTLKMSHLFWDIGWEKHMFDVQFLLREGIDVDEILLWKLIYHWREVKEPVRRSDLDMSKEEFFSNAVNYDVMEHDDLHLLVSETPMYKRLLKDGCEVELDEAKWYLMTHEEKILTIREEVYVMAFERYKSLGYRFAYNKMLKKFLRQHIPEFMFLFAIENWIELDKCPIDFLTLINNKMTKKTENVVDLPQTIELKILNNLLSNMEGFTHGRIPSHLKNVEKVETNQDDNFGEETGGGDTYSHNVYKIVDANCYVRITTACDSYGDNKTIYAIQFVHPQIIEKVEFTPIP